MGGARGGGMKEGNSATSADRANKNPFFSNEAKFSLEKGVKLKRYGKKLAGTNSSKIYASLEALVTTDS